VVIENIYMRIKYKESLLIKTMQQVQRIFNDIEMLSDKKSFKIGVWDSVKNLWILNHFNHLKIKKHKIIYQINNGIRQHKSTKHPIRKLQNKQKDICSLLNYLIEKPYDILCFELELENNWKMKIGRYIDMTFYTNSTDERNSLITKLLSIEGINLDKKKLGELENNFSYHINIDGQIIRYSMDFKLPDEFWSKEEFEEWKKEYYKIHM